MYVISIDVGTYSVKFSESLVERKSISHLQFHEIVISDYINQNSKTGHTLQDIQQEIITEYLTNRSREGIKIISQIPSPLLTARFLELPVKNKKKAEMMIPFQLEEDLPFSSAQMHLAYMLMETENGIFAVTNVLSLQTFEEYYRQLEIKNILPDIITSELALFQHAAIQREKEDSYIILDLGHETTKAYFVFQKKIVGIHISFVAGKTIDEVISAHYQISPEDAEIFKHENAFFLTDAQYDQVTPDQKSFAVLMRETLAPLINDIKRWSIGHRATHSLSPSIIYLTGGTSLIQNIDSFITQQLAIPTQHLEVIDKRNMKSQGKALSPQIQKTYGLIHLMGLAAVAKKNTINFRNGEYALSNVDEIPLHSAFFIGIRVGIIALVLILAMMSERFFLEKQNKQLQARAMNIFKNSELGVTSQDRIFFKKRPQNILAKFKSKEKQLESDVKTLNQESNVNTFTPLVRISERLGANPKVNLVSFSSSSNHVVKLIFEASGPLEAEKLKEQLKNMNFPKTKFSEGPDKNIVIVEYQDQ